MIITTTIMRMLLFWLVGAVIGGLVAWAVYQTVLWLNDAMEGPCKKRD